MNFSRFLQRKNRVLLPLSWLYGLGVLIHNKIFDWGWKTCHTPRLPVICIGNLSVGGTGKTPMVEYLLQLLSSHFAVATISRGYKRATHGVFIADGGTTATEIGDEPMQFHTKFPSIKVVVGEKRVQALEELLKNHPETEIVILDDAFQHRAICAGLNILLTDYQRLFTQDLLLPAGQLRDLKSSYKRADLIVVTKCNAALSKQEKETITASIRPLQHQSVFFTTIQYGSPYPVFGGNNVSLPTIKEVLLVTGIANPQPLAEQLRKQNLKVTLLDFPDHHNFSIKDRDSLLHSFNQIKDPNKIILTTEKDTVRLKQFADSLREFPVFAIPIQHRFLFDESKAFNAAVLKFISSMLKNPATFTP